MRKEETIAIERELITCDICGKKLLEKGTNISISFEDMSRKNFNCDNKVIDVCGKCYNKILETGFNIEKSRSLLSDDNHELDDMDCSVNAFKKEDKEYGDILNRVKLIIGKIVGTNAVLNYTGDCFIHNDLGADSLDAVEIAMALEKEFNITIPDNKMNVDRTINEIVEYILMCKCTENNKNMDYEK